MSITAYFSTCLQVYTSLSLHRSTVFYSFFSELGNAYLGWDVSKFVELELLHNVDTCGSY